MPQKLQEDFSSLITTAVSYHQRGRLAEADALYRRLLKIAPKNVDVLHLRGVLSYQSDRYSEAAKLMDRALKGDPAQPRFWANRGLVYVAQGQLRDAEKSYRHALKLKPDYMEVHNNLGNLYLNSGRVKEAEASYRQAVALKPTSPEAHNNLGTALQAMGQLEKAAISYREALALNSNYAEAHFNLGSLLKEMGKIGEAVASYRRTLDLRKDYLEAYSNLGLALKELDQLEEAVVCQRQALALKPNFAEGHNNLGNSLKKAGNLGEAEVSFRRAIALNPNYADAYSNLGNVLQDLNRRAEAEGYYQKAINLKPDFPEAHNNLGNALHDLGRLEEAATSLRKALSLQRDYVEAHSNLGRTMQDMGRWDEAEACYRRALDLKPDDPMTRSNLLYSLSARCQMAPAKLLEENLEWDRIQNAKGVSHFSHPLPSNYERKLRIGYVSPDLRSHVVAQFFEPLLAAHDRKRVEVLCYAEVRAPDETTKRLQRLADGWCFTVGMSDEALAQRIYDDHVDILVDLAGHTANNRLRAFIWKPAPVQATWLGYFAGTGLSAMDYWITDGSLHPADTIEQSVEEIVRLPRCWVCYRPVVEVPATKRDARRNEVMFGCFNHISKLTDETITCWSQILRHTPNARLLLKNKHLKDPLVQSTLTKKFMDKGVSSDRIELRGASSMDDYMACYGEIDVALDPFPRTGGTVTADALWMGVPVVTLAGSLYVERISAATLAGIGKSELIAGSTDDYVGIALALAQKGVRENEERQALRELVRNSELMDSTGLACVLEDTYEEFWEDRKSNRS